MLSRALSYLKIRIWYIWARVTVLMVSRASRSRLWKLLPRLSSSDFARVRDVPTLSSLVECRFHKIAPDGKRVAVYNPAIIAIDNGLLIVVATSSNRLIDFSWGGRPKVVGGEFRSELILGLIDELGDGELPLFSPIANQPEGLADARIFRECGEILIDVNREVQELGQPRQRIFTGTIGLKNQTLSRLVKLQPPNPAIHEKNWMPIEHDCNRGFVERIYSLDPFITVEHKHNTGELLATHNYGRILELQGFRGGSPVRKLGKYYYGVIHKTFYQPVRHYTHRFIKFKIDAGRLVPVSTSRDFVFQSQMDVEFCSGIFLGGDGVHLSFGYQDRESWLVRLDLEGFKDLAGEITLANSK